jgi:hypothetical protein
MHRTHNGEFRFGTTYWLASFLGFIWLAASLAQRRDPYEECALLWRWTNDQVLRGLIEFVLLAIAIFILPGILCVAVCLLLAAVVLEIFSVVLNAITKGLVLLFFASPTGAILSSVITVALLLLLGKIFWSLVKGYGSSQPARGRSSGSDSRISCHTANESTTSNRVAKPAEGLVGALLDSALGAVRDIAPDTSEYREAKYGAEFARGKEDRERAGFVDEVFHGLGDIFGTVAPSAKEHQSYEAGYHDKDKKHGFWSDD